MSERAPGWLLIHRRMADAHDALWNIPRVFSEWEARMDLLMQARFVDGPYVTAHGTDHLRRGEVVGSLRYLGKRWQWDKNAVSRFLESQETAGFIAGQRMGHHGRVYRVVNYELYQNPLPEAGQQTGRDSNHENPGQETVQETGQVRRLQLVGTAPSIEGGAPESGQQSGQTPGQAQRKNGTKEKEGSSKQGSTNTGEPLFDVAWSEYPKRIGGNSRVDALKAWRKRRTEGHSGEDMLAGTRRYRAFCDATSKTGTELVKQARTFFGPGLHFTEDWGLPAPALSEAPVDDPHAEQLAAAARDAAWLASRPA